MNHASPERVQEDGFHVYHEAPYHDPPAHVQDPYLAPEDSGQAATDKEHRIGGLRSRTFWLIIAAIAIIVIAVSVGGAVGGNQASQHSTSNTASAVTSSSSAAASSTPASTSSASLAPALISGYNITTDCPASGDSSNTPNAYFGGEGKIEFRKSCGSNTGGIDLISAFTPDFNTCIDLCSNWNYKNYETGLSLVRCTSAVFLVTGSPPNNYWSKNGTNLVDDQSTGPALLVD